MTWQKRARAGLAAFGLAFAVIVYFAIGERQAAAPAPRPVRFDPSAILESAGAVLQQFRGARQDYVIEAERQLTYEGGATTLVGITIKVRGKAGRDFTVSAREGQAGANQKELEIAGDVTMAASDGFVMRTDRATFNEADATVRAQGPVSFEKGGMTGYGVGMSYDRDRDVLSLAEEAHVEIADGQGTIVTEFTAVSATLARQENYLELEGEVHALRGEQVIEADRGVAQLSENEEYITFIELRGNARVVGGGAFEAVTARDIDLDYSDDGQWLERVALTGSGAIVLKGEEEGSGRQLAGETLNLTFAPDATLTRAVGRGDVRFDLPAAAGAPVRSVKAQSFAAAGEPGRGLTSVSFTGDVDYREGGQRNRAPRIARSNALRITLADDALTAAVFTGSTRFEEQRLQASAATAQYDPRNGTLQLSGADAGGAPRVADERITVEAAAIDLTLQGRRMLASGGVKTTLRAGGAAAPSQAAERGAAPDAGTRLPGLLQEGQPANVNADRLEYEGAAGKAVYSGTATLWQGETAVRADVITLDQASGDLIAAGNARTNLALDADASVGRAAEIRYDDATRRLTFLGILPPATVPGVAPTSGGPVAPTGAGVLAPVSAAPIAPTSAAPLAPTAAGALAPTSAAPIAPAAIPAQLSGPQGDLRAGRIDLILGEGGGRADRLEAHRDVDLRLDTRTATGDRLIYFAADERYEIVGVPTVPVTIVESCRQTIGRTVTFFKSTERVIVDGNEEARTQSKRGGPCPQAPVR